MRQKLREASDAWYRWRFAAAVVAVFAIAAGSLLAAGRETWLGRTVRLSDARAELGHAVIATLSHGYSSDQAPLESLLYEIRPVHGVAAFAERDLRWGWSLTYWNLRARILAKYPNYQSEQRQVIGPGNQQHQDIRDSGGGRYSVWKGALYFSASDNTSPLSNGRRYELFVPWMSAHRAGLAAGGLRAAGLTLLILTILRVLSERQLFRRLLANTIPGVLVTLALFAVAFGVFEIYQRTVRHAFVSVVWNTTLDPVAGVVFKPNEEVRWTNHLDFWTRERANSMGFLDAEPAIPKPAGRFRLLLVGDSFVEAAQVRNDQKLQSLLAARVNERLGAGHADAAAMGSSGTGQANQLGFYDRFGKALAPDVVVLLAVSNDFANNSPLLEAVRNGWAPYHPPRRFVELDAGQYRTIAPDLEWLRWRMPAAGPAEYYKTLAASPEFGPRFKGWGGPTALEIDDVFWRRELPPLFQDAVTLTRHALEEWKQRADRDGFRLVVVATENLTRPGADAVSDGTLYLKRFEQIAEDTGIPFFDLAPTFAKQSNRAAGFWKYDSHWSPQGHRWAADAIYQFLGDSGLLPDRAGSR